MYRVPPSEFEIRFASNKIISSNLDISLSFERARPICDKLPICSSRSEIYAFTALGALARYSATVVADCVCFFVIEYAS